MRALVLSGGGLFGAWQAGAWSVLAPHFKPDLIVGASIGSVNGYLIASGASHEELRDIWSTPQLGSLRDFQTNLQSMTSRYRLSPDVQYALTVTDLLRMKPKIYHGPAVTWKHLAASCAVPIAMPQIRIDDRWYSDGGLQNALPAWAAAELGATDILGLHVLPEVPSRLLRPFVKAFRAVRGHYPDLAGVKLEILYPSTYPKSLGSMRDALQWDRGNIERWLDLGARDARNFLSRL